MVKDHNEFVCHAVGERRQNYLNQIKCILDQMEDAPCTPHYEEPCAPPTKPLLRYPGYLDSKNPRYKQPFYVPLVTNVQIKELRPTSEYPKHAHENDYKLQYYAVDPAPTTHTSSPWVRPRYNSFELRGGRFYSGCDCFKHNGIQDQCERMDCGGRPECLTEPFPTCPPSQTYPQVRPQETLAEKFARAEAANPPRVHHFCCCRQGQTGQDRPLPAHFDCYPCTK